MSLNEQNALTSPFPLVPMATPGYNRAKRNQTHLLSYSKVGKSDAWKRNYRMIFTVNYCFI